MFLFKEVLRPYATQLIKNEITVINFIKEKIKELSVKEEGTWIHPVDHKNLQVGLTEESERPAIRTSRVQIELQDGRSIIFKDRHVEPGDKVKGIYDPVLKQMAIDTLADEIKKPGSGNFRGLADALDMKQCPLKKGL